jgi:hypothetical protein
MTSEQVIAERTVVELREREPIGEIGRRGRRRRRRMTAGDACEEREPPTHRRKYGTSQVAGSGKMLFAIAIAACTHASTADTPEVSLPAVHEVVSEIRSSTIEHDPKPPPAPRIVRVPVMLVCGQVCRQGDFSCFMERRQICSTPLVVAYEPIELVVSNAKFAFTPGVPVASAWPTSATPWIVLDRDGDGAITSGAELFGDSTGDAHDGFEAIAQLDDNGDGVVDARDSAFARLQLWADADGDRKSTPAELRPLAAEITAIPLAHDGVRGSARLADGRSVDVVDLYLRTW